MSCAQSRALLYVFLAMTAGNLVDVAQHVAAKYGSPGKIKRCAGPWVYFTEYFT